MYYTYSNYCKIRFQILQMRSSTSVRPAFILFSCLYSSFHWLFLWSFKNIFVINREYELPSTNFITKRPQQLGLNLNQSWPTSQSRSSTFMSNPIPSTLTVATITCISRKLDSKARGKYPTRSLQYRTCKF